MAKNRVPEKLVESDTESGEEEDDDTSSEEAGSQESESEPERAQITKKPSSSTPASVKKPQPPSASKSQQGEPSSSSDEEESESESESDSDGPHQKVGPIATKPMDDQHKSNKGARKPRPAASDLDTPTKSATGKRPAEEKETETKDAKKSKNKPVTSERKVNNDSKKSLFQRLWSEDDEIAILKGMIDYKAKKKSDPVTDLNAFHDFIKKNLHVDVTRTQLQDKIRRLKKKYENNKSKEKEGKEKTFFKPHEQKAYELSKYVWGNEIWKENVGEMGARPIANGSIAKKAQPRRANGADNEDGSNEKSVVVVNDDSERMLPAKRMKRNGATVEESILMFGNEIFEEGKGHEKENEWKKLRMEEMEAYTRHLEVKAAQARLVVDNMKSAGH
ncbi:hypothetical protein OROGR_001142 [Orobanche gracilis]